MLEETYAFFLHGPLNTTQQNISKIDFHVAYVTCTVHMCLVTRLQARLVLVSVLLTPAFVLIGFKKLVLQPSHTFIVPFHFYEGLIYT